MESRKSAKMVPGLAGLAVVAMLGVSCEYQEQPRYGPPIVINGKVHRGCLEQKIMYKGRYMYISAARELAAAEAARAAAFRRHCEDDDDYDPNCPICNPRGR